MKKSFPILAGLALFLTSNSSLADCGLANMAGARGVLFDAMQSRDSGTIEQAIADMKVELKGQPPEGVEKFDLPDQRALKYKFPKKDIVKLAGIYLDSVEKNSWWLETPVPKPADIPYALRFAADTIRGTLAVADAFPQYEKRALQLADAAGQYLVTASKEADFSGTPFPKWTGKGGVLGKLSDKITARLEECGELDQNVKNGWFVVTEVPWEYYFDTGSAGEALAMLQKRSPKPQYDNWLQNAYKWSKEQPLSVNFNYNAFTANFFITLGLYTNTPQAVNLAADRIKHGVLPGMTETGRWLDPHNDRIVYRSIMVRGMINVAHGLKEKGNLKQANLIGRSANKALAALETQMKEARGITVPDHMIDLYLDLIEARQAGAPLKEPDPKIWPQIQGYITQFLYRKKISPPAVASTGRYLAFLKHK